MTFDKVRNYCLSFEGAYEDLPFGKETLVFKVGSKMFALMGLDNDPLRLNLKCEPEKAIELRERYPMNVKPGYHMSKKHWNTVILKRPVEWKKVEEWISDSYDLVFSKLTKKEQRKIRNEG